MSQSHILFSDVFIHSLMLMSIKQKKKVFLTLIESQNWAATLTDRLVGTHEQSRLCVVRFWSDNTQLCVFNCLQHLEAVGDGGWKWRHVHQDF